MQGSEWAQWMQSPCVQSSVTPNHRGSRTDTHNSDKSDRICIQRQQKKKKEEGINKKWTILRRKGRWRVSRERVVNYFKKVSHVTRRVRGRGQVRRLRPLTADIRPAAAVDVLW